MNRSSLITSLFCDRCTFLMLEIDQLFTVHRTNLLEFLSDMVSEIICSFNIFILFYTNTGAHGV
jgi:hypothetical protein